MTVTDVLTGCGLKVSGPPPLVTVDVAGTAVDVRAVESGAMVELTATVPVSITGWVPDFAAMSERGPATFSATREGVRGTRSLDSPDPATLYDAVFDLAKGVSSLARLVSAGIDLEPSPAAPTAPAAAAATATTATRTITVDADQAVTASDGAVVGRLVAGRTYFAGRAEGGWVEVTDDGGVTGWVPAHAVRPT